MTDERLETRGESQQAEVANAPGRNFPPGTPFEIGELSRLAYAIGRSGMQLFASDLAPVINVPSDDSRTDGKSVVSNHAFVINVPSDDSRTDGKSVVSNHALRTIRDVLIWLTRNEPTEAAEPSEPAAVDRAEFAFSLNEDMGYTLSKDDRLGTIQLAVDQWIDKHDDFTLPQEITVYLATSLTHVEDYLRKIADGIGDDVLESIACDDLEEFSPEYPAFDWNARDEAEVGSLVVEEVLRRFKPKQYRIDHTEEVKVRILDIRGAWELVAAAEPAGETV